MPIYGDGSWQKSSGGFVSILPKYILSVFFNKSFCLMVELELFNIIKIPSSRVSLFPSQLLPSRNLSSPSKMLQNRSEWGVLSDWSTGNHFHFTCYACILATYMYLRTGRFWKKNVLIMLKYCDFRSDNIHTPTTDEISVDPPPPRIFQFESPRSL